MTELKDIMAYILNRYPHRSDLSNARLTKMIYLVDWKHALSTGKQLTSIRWYFDNYGPFVSDVRRTAESNPDMFCIQQTANMFGDEKSLFALKSGVEVAELPSTAVEAIEHVIKSTSSLNWSAFIKLVYGTYPITSYARYSFLDLEKSAKAYKKD